MHGSPLLDRVCRCLAVLRDGLDGATLGVDDDGAEYAWWAVPVLCRGVFLCEASAHLASTELRPAAAVLVRPAIECWIDACYVMYCRHEAVLALGAGSLKRREALARVWLGNIPDDLVEQRATLEGVVEDGRRAGYVSDAFAAFGNVPLNQRLEAAIRCRQAPQHYMEIYDIFYRGLSFTDVHSAAAVETNSTMTDATAEFRVTSTELYDVDALLAVVTGCLCDAGVDAFALLGIDSANLTVRKAEMLEELAPRIQQLADRLAAAGSGDDSATSD